MGADSRIAYTGLIHPDGDSVVHQLLSRVGKRLLSAVLENELDQILFLLAVVERGRLFYIGTGEDDVLLGNSGVKTVFVELMLFAESEQRGLAYLVVLHGISARLFCIQPAAPPAD